MMKQQLQQWWKIHALFIKRLRIFQHLFLLLISFIRSLLLRFSYSRNPCELIRKCVDNELPVSWPVFGLCLLHQLNSIFLFLIAHQLRFNGGKAKKSCLGLQSTVIGNYFPDYFVEFEKIIWIFFDCIVHMDCMTVILTLIISYLNYFLHFD